MDRRVKRTRDAIFGAFDSLLREMPFEKISVNDIAERADINRSTFYLHFVDKYELFDAYLNQQMQEFYDHSGGIREVRDQEEVRSTLHFIFSYFEKNREFFDIMFREDNAAFFSKKFRAAVYEVLSKDLSEAGDMNGIQMQFQLQVRVSALIGTIEWWLENGIPLSVDEITEDILEIFLKLETDL